MDPILTGLAKRRLLPATQALMAEEPVLILTGPRTVGKSTLLSQLAGDSGRSIVDCDDPATRAAVRNDPGRFVAAPGPVFIDEYQHVPEVLDAIKAELNKDLQPGRFVLAGSTRYSAVPEAGRALTGRAHIVPVLPLSQGEIGSRTEDLVDRLLDGDGSVLDIARSATTRHEYAARATSGGMPLAIRRPAGRSRSRWFSSYISLVVDRDVVELTRIRQREMLPRLLTRLAACTGQVLNISAASEAVGLERSTAENYVGLLEAVFLIQRLPAWGTTLGSRVTRHPKVHIVDSGLAAWLLGLTLDKITQGEPAVLAEYGHLLETFVVGEVLKQVSWRDESVAAGYFRTGNGDEVDLVLERPDGQVIAVEVKAGTRVHGEDLRGLRALRRWVGTRLEFGVVFYTGEYSFGYEEEGILVMPIDRLWRQPAQAT
jgi:predicted AAA+ superfamily ATPase